jgi:hypothetical protein
MGADIARQNAITDRLGSAVSNELTLKQGFIKQAPGRTPADPG